MLSVTINIIYLCNWAISSTVCTLVLTFWSHPLSFWPGYYLLDKVRSELMWRLTFLLWLVIKTQLALTHRDAAQRHWPYVLTCQFAVSMQGTIRLLQTVKTLSQIFFSHSPNTKSMITVLRRDYPSNGVERWRALLKEVLRGKWQNGLLYVSKIETC